MLSRRNNEVVNDRNLVLLLRFIIKNKNYNKTTRRKRTLINSTTDGNNCRDLLNLYVSFEDRSKNKLFSLFLYD